MKIRVSIAVTVGIAVVAVAFVAVVRPREFAQSNALRSGARSIASRVDDGAQSASIIESTAADVDQSQPKPVAIESSADREMRLNQLCLETAQTDPLKAIEIVDRELSGERAELMLRDIVKEWAARDLDAALTWVSTRPEGESRDALFSEVAGAIAEVDPEKAARIVSDRIAPGAIQSAAALSVLDRWAQTDLAAATEWVNTFPESQARDHAVLHLGRVAFYQQQLPQR